MSTQQSHSNLMPINFVYKTKLLMQSNSEIFKIKDGIFAFKKYKFDKSGNLELDDKYVICKRKRLHFSNIQIVHECSCEEAIEEVDCIHCELAMLLWPPHLDFPCLGEEFEYCHLEKSLSAVYCAKDNSYGIINVCNKQRRCMVCIKGNTKCNHVKAYQEFTGESGNIDIQTFESVSKKKKSPIHSLNEIHKHLSLMHLKKHVIQQILSQIN